MKDYGKQRSTVKPDEMVIDEFSVWIHSNIQEVSEPGIDDQEGFTGYEFNMVQYTKDEFIMKQAEISNETNKILNTMLGVNE